MPNLTLFGTVDVVVIRRAHANFPKEVYTYARLLPAIMEIDFNIVKLQGF